MDLISLAVPFFLIAIAIEIWIDRRQGSGYIPLADALGSLSAGAMSTLTGVFGKLIGIAIYAFFLAYVAPFEMPIEWFDASWQGVLAWTGALLAFDFFYYWKHRFGHEISLFWAAHSVHHQSEEYNLTTALRQTSTDFLVGWSVYIPLFLIGLPLEVFATVSAIDLIYQFWVHTRFVDKLGWVDYVFVTPSNHRVHHAQNARYIDKNYGGILVIWDRLFGTFEPENDDDPPIFGVRKALGSFNPLNANLHVYRSLWADARATKRWQDKIKIWFARTGWRPTDCELSAPLRLRPLEQFAKYQPDQSQRVRRYLVIQFVVTLLATLGFQSVPLPAVAGYSLIAIVCFQLVGIGLVSDLSRVAKPYERGRVWLTALLVIGVAITLADDAWLLIAGFAIAYAMLSEWLLSGIEVAVSRPVR